MVKFWFLETDGRTLNGTCDLFIFLIYPLHNMNTNEYIFNKISIVKKKSGKGKKYS